MAIKNILVAAALTASSLAAPILEERDSCAAEWAQCGGINWTGATCCVSALSCVSVNSYYYQCLSESSTTTAGTTSTTLATTTATTTTTATSSSSSLSTRSTTSVASSTTTTSVATTTTSTSATATVSTTAVSVTATTASTTTTFSGNPFSGVQQWVNSYYASEISASAIPTLTSTNATMATAAAQVGKVPTFLWLDTAAKVGTQMQDTLSAIRAANQAGASPQNAGIFVVYDLPDRDCAAAASNGEYSIADNGVEYYKAYIDSIKELLVTFSDVRTILIVEPDSLANMVTNLSVEKCAEAEDAYYECINYAVTELNLANVAMYLDAGHAGWLGWSANLSPAATLFATVYKNASSPSQLRGLATNVANYNGWNLTSAPSYTSGDSNYDELLYVEAIQPLLSSAGFDAYFITEQSRSGKQPTGQSAWGDWCNAKGTGFGTHPTSSTGLSIEDAFVWVKPGGESDGTSNTTSSRYDYHCGYSDALTPAPEAGTWFEAYFEQLLTNANPSFF